jgi:hypothetical protein
MTARVRIPECRQIPYRLAFGIDRLTPTRRVVAPIWDQPPAQRIERDFTGLVITANDEQFLAWRGIPPRRIIMHATIAHIHAIDDRIPKRPAALDDSPAHDRKVGIRRRACQSPQYKQCVAVFDAD